MSILNRGLLALSLLLGASTAIAADGAVEINAACVAEGCFEGDNPGFPVEINNAGSYILTSNLEISDAGTTGIHISIRNVSLDLNGFALRGPVTCSGTPVTSCSATGNGSGIDTYPGTRIHDGHIVGFGRYGIYASSYNHLENLHIENNAEHGIRAGAGTRVQNCDLVRNGDAGISAFTSQSMLELTNSLMRENRGEGAAVTAGVVRDNRFHNNGDYGLRASSAGGDNAVSYAGNVFFGNSDGTANR